jgi:hypothetical protein
MLTHAASGQHAHQQHLLELRFHQGVPPCLDRLDILGKELEDISLQRRLGVSAYLRTYATHALEEEVTRLRERARVRNDAPVLPQKHRGVLRIRQHTSAAYVSIIRQQHT